MTSRGPTVLDLGALAGRGVQRLMTDAALGSRRPVPRRVDNLDAVSLSAIVGRRVTAAQVIDASNGTSSRARLALTGEDVPESAFVKLSAATATTRMLGELAALGENEVRFYRTLAPELAGDVPESYGAQFDSVTGRFAIVLEDLAAGPPCEFPDVVHPLDADKMTLLMELFGRVHGTFFGRLGDRGEHQLSGWLQLPSADPSNPVVPSIMRLSARRLVRNTTIPVMAGRFIWENHQAVTAAIDHGPHTLLHGDAHPGNTYFRNGKAGLLDWQVVRRGHPARDLAYAMIFGLSTVDRRNSERDLLDVYRQALMMAGGPEIDFDDLWTRYRQAAAYTFVSSLTTAGLGGMQSDAVALEGLQRTVVALDDLDTVKALREAL
ncbi:phosphotransferase [soil metagenome]